MKMNHTYYYFKKITEFLLSILINSIYLKNNFASTKVIYTYIKFRFLRSFIIKKFKNQNIEFKYEIKKLNHSTDWFSDNIPYWCYVFEKCNFKNDENLKILEIGSWEGLSAYFLFSKFSNSQITCVDTWLGADEHRNGDQDIKTILTNSESTFDATLVSFTKRLIKFKGTSFLFFATNNLNNYYDLIYLDGSHFCDDVLIDAIKAYDMLKANGLLIFDDYLWKYYKSDIDNPASAINLFLKLKNRRYKLRLVSYQIIIQKIY